MNSIKVCGDDLALLARSSSTPTLVNSPPIFFILFGVVSSVLVTSKTL